VFFADNMNIQNTEINLKKLRASFDAGMQQTRKDWPEIMSFLNQTR